MPRPLALSGFGASAHLVLQLARHLYPQSPVYVFARSPHERGFALRLGAAWAGDYSETPPALPHAVIDTTPVWSTVIRMLEILQPGGRLVINAIRKEDADKSILAALDYPTHLWLEKEIKSIANVTRADITGFLDLAAAIPIFPAVHTYPLHHANLALDDLAHGRRPGAKVLLISPSPTSPSEPLPPQPTELTS